MKSARIMMIIGAALSAFGLGWALSWALMPQMVALRGTSLALPSGYVLFLEIAYLALVILTGLVFSGRRVRYLLSVGCVFLLGTSMGTFRVLPFVGGKGMPLLGVKDALDQILPCLLAQWPLELAFLCCAAALCVVYLLARRASDGKLSRAKIALFLAAVMGIGFCTFLVRDSMRNLEQKAWTWKDSTLSFYGVTGKIMDFNKFLQFYEQDRGRLRGMSIHVWSNMPGKTLMYYAFYRMRLELSSVHYIVIVLFSLAAIPIFFVARRLASTRVAVGATVLFFLFPGPPLLFPSANAVTVLLAMLALWLVLICLEKRDPALGIAAGLCLAALFFYEPLPFVLTLLLVPYIWRAFRADAWGTVALFAALAMGFAAFYIAIYAWSGVSVFKITSDTIKYATLFNQESDRGYLLYAPWNFVEIGTAIGWSALLLWAFGAARSARALFRRGEPLLGRLLNETPARSAVFAFSFFMLILILDLSGANRAEVYRLWLFLMPLFGAGAVWAAEELQLRGYVPLLCGLLFAQGLLAQI